MVEKRNSLLLRAMVCGLVLTVLWSSFTASAAGETLSEKIVRLHVVANSDSEQDQRVKLFVRDAVLQEAEAICEGAETAEQASAQLCVHLGAIEQAANEALRQNGCDDEAGVTVTNAYFSTREYESFTLPAGTYRTLRVTIGEGKGHNWWCVVFPSLCLPAAQEEAMETLPKSATEVIQNPERYRIGFKLTEWVESLRNTLDF